jgi:glycosyltransferase involved in cell wall biosynthesis
MRIGLQQRVLPVYRAPFFDALAEACGGELSVFAGQPRPDESISTANELQVGRLVRARNLHFLGPSSSFYLCWQPGLLRWLEDWQPDTLIVEANPRYPATRLAVRWMHARYRPVIGWGLGAPALSGPLASLRQRERLGFLHSLDAVIAYSQRGAGEYRALGFPSDGVFVAPNAATRRPPGPPPERAFEPDSQPVVLFIGRLQARKRLDSLDCGLSGRAQPVKNMKESPPQSTNRPSSWAPGAGLSSTRFSLKPTCSFCPAPGGWQSRRRWLLACR